MAKTIEQSVVLPAAPAQVYAALIDSKQHSAFTGAPATCSPDVGGAFSCHDGKITGINVELVPGQRIVQAWRAPSFPAGAFSIATFSLKPAGGGQTQLDFVQHGVPDEAAEGITKGWGLHYWEPLKSYLASK